MDVQNDISEKLKNTLDNYGEVLKQCTETMKNNTNINKEKIGEIRALVTNIKERIMNANQKLSSLNQQRDDYNKARDEKMAELKKKFETDERTRQEEISSLRTKQQQQEEENRKALADAERISSEKLLTTTNEINERHKNEMKTEIDKIKKADEEELKEQLRLKEEQDQAKLMEQQQQMQNKITQIEEDKNRKDNELLENTKKLAELTRENENIKNTVADDKQKIEQLLLQNQKFQEELATMTEEMARINNAHSQEKIDLVTKYEEENKNLIEEHQKEIKRLNEEAAKTNEAQIKELNERFETRIVEQIEETKNAVNKARDILEDERVNSSKGVLDGINEQLEKCNNDKEAFKNQIDEAERKINELNEKFKAVEQVNFNKLGEDVKSLEVPVTNLEKLVGVSGSGESGSGVSETGRISLDRSESFEGRQSLIDEAGSLRDESEAALRDTENTDKYGKEIGYKGWKEIYNEEQGKYYYYNPATQVTQWEDPRLQKIAAPKEDEGSGGIDKTKYIDYKDNLKIAEALKKDVNAFIGKIDSKEKMRILIDNVLHKHGIPHVMKGKYDKALDNFKDGKNYKKTRAVYEKALMGVIDGGLEEEIYNEIIERIKITSVEEVFEELLAAFHLVYHPSAIYNVYSMGDDSTHANYRDSDYKRNGKVAAYIWKPIKKGAFFDGERLKDNARRNGDNKLQNVKNVSFHMYKHSHDPLGQAGGFRHGKRSKKENRRSLKSKLKAKKYSLKSKKKGKNKSKKRRKSIKIRIN